MIFAQLILFSLKSKGYNHGKTFLILGYTRGQVYNGDNMQFIPVIT